MVHTITIQDNSVSTNEELVFNYENIGPGFSANTPIAVINTASSVAELDFTNLFLTPSNQNKLFSAVNLSLQHTDTLIHRSTPGQSNTKFTNRVVCLNPGASTNFLSHLDLPTDTNNSIQQTSFGISYNLAVTVGSCNPDKYNDPDPEPINPPNTGINPSVPAALGTATITGFGLIIACIIALIIAKIFRRNRQDSTHSAYKNYRTLKTQQSPKKPRLFANIFLALCLLTAACAIALGITARNSGQPISIFGFQPYIIATGSMSPEYAIHSFALTHNDNFDDIQVGDVVASRAPAISNSSALHRVVDITGDGDQKSLTVQGDSNPNPDSTPVTRSNYLGRIVWHTNLTAHIASFFSHPLGWIITSAILILIVATIVFIHKIRQKSSPN